MQLTLIDLNWTGRSKSIAAALLKSADYRAIVDPGPASTIPTLKQHLRSHHVQVSDLNAIYLTHIHLDHAAATGALVRENPRIEVYVHERGAPHMADPAKLNASAKRLYGDAMDRLYGEFLPVPPENLRPLRGGETFFAGDCELSVLYTPGHASHHVTYFDEQEGTAFVGDTAGVCIEGEPFVLPVTPPPDIDLPLWNASLQAIAEREPARLFLTHFGVSNDPVRHLSQYRERLSEWLGLVETILGDGMDESTALRKFVETTTQEIMRTHSGAEAEAYVHGGGLPLSWLGLTRYIRKRAS
jgi:glyoxylase-like metal-dependent hydrolase (beta-lactamase superfamily II)